ncbi:hypothetical protein KEC55_19685 [Burkholderia cepacia]|uniref:hypothetical protein n=1 Tax=Burkholderia cepacia TaxID=292 RepID=UPI00249DFF3B|nr:hypothetical protein [Burkholderia cepacia]WGY72033.1 hypothetical protein KEC55_19685 [Burkholderia cepacia]
MDRKTMLDDAARREVHEFFRKLIIEADAIASDAIERRYADRLVSRNLNYGTVLENSAVYVASYGFFNFVDGETDNIALNVIVDFTSPTNTFKVLMSIETPTKIFDGGNFFGDKSFELSEITEFFGGIPEKFLEMLDAYLNK